MDKQPGPEKFRGYNILGIGEETLEISRYESVGKKMHEGAIYYSFDGDLSEDKLKENFYNEIWMENVVGSWANYRLSPRDEILSDFKNLYDSLRSGGKVYVVEAYTPIVAAEILGTENNPPYVDIKEIGFKVTPIADPEKELDKLGDVRGTFRGLHARIWVLEK